ncbi:hypothetical protein C8A03DRAFT_38996 [Achaetomium macrosporum]|uniref:Uncharacterized protein n=1 Tax=Achaetomium macrosporum TaxID=79813 RepID=A0AAN7C0Y6_9PEZI|nr:hypothetical protein C8A03DRAFT_38996 [Achaetomium macrosporum]
MLTNSRVLQRRLGASLAAATRTATVPRRSPLVQQIRGVAAVPGKDPDNMGGPGGQEHLPESNSLRRRYTMVTAAGVLAACGVMLYMKMGNKNPDAKTTQYVLVHDNSKGELDDVKRIKVTELPKS